VSVLSFALFSVANVSAQQPRPLDLEVKAVYLLNFGRFARWPSPDVAIAPKTFSLCVLGRDPFGTTLDSVVRGETIGGKLVVARRLARPEDAVGCDVLFISAPAGSRIKSILEKIDRAATLTVSDIPDFVEQGGMIQFVPDGARIRFAVNVAATERVGLMLSSELLRVAVAIKTDGKPGT
jgi:hypothetical protein